MKKILFVSDLDNTLLFSWKKCHPRDLCVEKKDGIEQGFMTEFTYNSLEIINKITTFVPVTSRSINQYRRIQWNDKQLPEYAIVANGGVLLKNGKVDVDWLKESKESVKPYENEMKNLYDIFNSTGGYIICRIVDDMYFYVHCYDESQAADCITKYKKNSQLEVFLQGTKVYFFPPVINKGIAIERLKEYISNEKIIATGDSSIDLPMLQKADYAIIPRELENSEWNGSNMVNVCNEKNFSNYICEQILKICKDTYKGNGDNWIFHAR